MTAGVHTSNILTAKNPTCNVDWNINCTWLASVRLSSLAAMRAVAGINTWFMAPVKGFNKRRKDKAMGRLTMSSAELWYAVADASKIVSIELSSKLAGVLLAPN